jgi:hypothetical protein
MEAHPADSERGRRPRSLPGRSSAAGGTDCGAELVQAGAAPQLELRRVRPFPAVSVPTLGMWSSGDDYLVEDSMVRSAAHVTGQSRERAHRRGRSLDATRSSAPGLTSSCSSS